MSYALRWLVLCVLACSACSVSRKKNPQYIPRAECERRGGHAITEQFCDLTPTKNDAGLDAATPDGGGPREACTDDGAMQFCYEAEDQSTAQQPPCRAGTRICRDGYWSGCEGQVRPQPETCNGSDDDCDGHIDEELAKKDCDVPDQQGTCAKGSEVCVAGKVQCNQQTFPRADTCNGQDDDCDGKTDEGTQLRCYPVAEGCKPSSTLDGNYECSGRCATGTFACMNGAYSDTCEGFVMPDTSEHCTDVGESAVDEDCDGKVDEGCTCKAGVSCYTGSPSETQIHAPCRAGTQACSDATHGTCQGEVTPKPEDCGNEGVDDDCDGKPDNVPARGTACADASSGQGACKANATWQCQGGKQVCVDASPQSAEVCDGHGGDEDCDGKVDEGFDLQTDENNCGACGAVCSQGLTCCAGICVTTSANKSHCGACGHACSAAETCCSGTCANTNTSTDNCGSCGNSCALLGLTSCGSGSCRLL